MDVKDLDCIFAATRGVFTAPMLPPHGISRRTFRRWQELGLIERVCGNAFVRRGHAITVMERAIGARLTWPDAIVCFITAAVLLGMDVKDDGIVHVLVPTPRRPLPGMQPHFWSVRPTEVIRWGPLVITDRPTTLADCLGRMPNDDAWGMLAWAFTREQITADDVAAQIADRFHLYGVVRLRQMAAALRRNAVSPPEVQLQEFLEEQGIVGWTGNFSVRSGGRVLARGDIGFQEAKLVIEYDGKDAHGPAQQADDELRAARLRNLGYDVLRVTWTSLHQRRRLLRDLIRQLLRTEDKGRRRSLALAWNESRYLDLAELLATDARIDAVG